MDERAWAAIRRGLREGTLPVIAGVVLLLWTRLSYPIPGVGNPDIAGMLYEADLIRTGGVPFVDALDMKPPGTFFLIAGIFATLGRSLGAVKVVYAAWCLLAAPAIWLAARALSERKSAAGIAVLLYLASIGTFDPNYASWMVTAYAWAFALLILAIRGKASWLHLAAGAAAAIAFALKGQAIVIGPVFALVWIWGRRRDEPGAGLVAWPLWLAGAALGLLPLALFYARHDALGALLSALVPVGEAGSYSARARLENGWWLHLWRIPLQEIRAFPVQTLLVAAVGVAALRARREAWATTAPLAPAVILFALSVAACGIGGLRFYLHYLPQVLPGLCLLAAHPLAFDGFAGRVRLGVIGVAMFLGAGVVGRIPLGRAVSTDYGETSDAKLAGEYVRGRTTPEDRILVWGWQAWPAYYFAERRSPSVVFKVLGQVTEYNTNGMFSPTGSTAFKRGPIADRLLAEFKASPPAFFVQTREFFPGVEDDPLDEFVALKRIVDRDYEQVATFGDVEVYERSSRAHGGAG